MNQSCIDRNGLSIASGRRYFPDEHDHCMNCLCNGGVPEACKLVMCQPPPCKVYEALPDTCCQYHCLLPAIDDHTALVPVNEINNTDLAVRISASALTSALMIMLVIFMMYRLRRQRMVLLMRNMQLQTMSEMAELHNGHFDLNGGHTYHGPPPPYTPPKPTDDFSDELPPPYDSLAEPQHTNVNMPDHEYAGPRDIPSRTVTMSSRIVDTHRRTVSATAVGNRERPTAGTAPAATGACQCSADDTNNNSAVQCAHSQSTNGSVRCTESLPRSWQSWSRDPIMGQSRKSFRQSSVRGRYWTSCDYEPELGRPEYAGEFACNARTENRLAGRQPTDSEHCNVILLEQRHFVDHT